MSFDEHAVYVREETLKAIQLNDKNIRLMEKVTSVRGSKEFLMMDQFLGEKLKEKLTPSILGLYRETKAMIPGLAIDIKNIPDLSKGEFMQQIEFKLYKEVIGRCVIYSTVTPDGEEIHSKLVEMK